MDTKHDNTLVSEFLQRPSRSTLTQFSKSDLEDLAVHLGLSKANGVPKKVELRGIVEELAVSAGLLEAARNRPHITQDHDISHAVRHVPGTDGKFDPGRTCHACKKQRTLESDLFCDNVRAGLHHSTHDDDFQDNRPAVNKLQRKCKSVEKTGQSSKRVPVSVNAYVAGQHPRPGVVRPVEETLPEDVPALHITVDVLHPAAVLTDSELISLLEGVEYCDQLDFGAPVITSTAVAPEADQNSVWRGTEVAVPDLKWGSVPYDEILLKKGKHLYNPVNVENNLFLNMSHICCQSMALRNLISTKVDTAHFNPPPLRIVVDNVEVVVYLWREAAIASVQVGDALRFPHLKTECAESGHLLQSTNFTHMEKCQINYNGVTVIGISSDEGSTLQLLLEDGQVLAIKQATWNPFDQALMETTLKVDLQVQGNMIEKNHNR
ncbi:uncharacterized protein V6R79_004912 [Siganus canaliculatus]